MITQNACVEILGLFDKLAIPRTEQVILVKMADKLCCKDFRNILFTLSKKISSSGIGGSKKRGESMHCYKKSGQMYRLWRLHWGLQI
jgi:hypothetical protein